MKKVLSLLLACCILVGFLPVTTYATEPSSTFATDPNATTRDIVLLLDNSESMLGTQLTYLKTAAKKFCQSLFESDGINRLSIIIYDTAIVNTINFTTDIDTLNNAIDNMDGEGNWTNIGAAARKASELLDMSSASIKNIVILTDGLPTYGNTASSGRYDVDDIDIYYGYTGHYVYEFANALYTEVTAMHSKYNIYTFGFFHNMSDEQYAFGQQLLKDLQNCGYYEVTDPEDLEFTFGELADDVINTGDMDPIIVIPGIMGSRLFTSNDVFDSSTRVWDPPTDSFSNIWDIHRLNEQMDVRNILYVRPCENQNDTNSGTVATYGREYGAVDTYKKLVDGLCEEFPNRAVYVFSYDWRHSNEDNARKLAEVINNVGADKVDLVCHSMGGLVASSYYKMYASDGKIDKIITCGTPYEGAPTLINNVQNWDVLGDNAFHSADDWKDIFLAVWGGMRSDLKASFLGVAQLTPTKNYVSRIPMQKDSAWPFGWCDYDLTYYEYVEICNEIFSTNNFTNAVNFQESLHSDSGYNLLLDYEKAYFLIGVNQPTITAVKFQWSNNDIDQKLYESDVSYEIKGDGTVPYLSASIMERVENLDETRWVTKAVNHTNTVKNAECIEWVIDILKEGSSSITSDSVDDESYTVIRIACPVDVTITTDAGTLSSNPDNYMFSSDFGRLDIMGADNEIKFLCIRTSDLYNIVLNGTGDGTMDYTIRFYDSDGNQYDERIFDDVPITEDTVMYTDATPDNEVILEVDTDGDGNIDGTWTAEPGTWTTEDDDSRIPLESISLTAQTQSIFVRESMALTLVTNPVNTTDMFGVIYSSSDESVLSVDQDGIVTGHSVGTAVITATTSNGLEAQIEITVTDRKLGDVNGDGIVTGADTNLVFRYVSGTLELTPEQLSVADINRDGCVTGADTNLIFRFVSGTLAN